MGNEVQRTSVRRALWRVLHLNGQVAAAAYATLLKQKKAGAKTPALSFVKEEALGHRFQTGTIEGSEREQDIPDLSSPARLLEIAERTAATIGHTHLGNTFVSYAVIGFNIARANYTRHH